MADDDIEEGQEGNGGGGKKKIILFAVLILVLIGLTVGGTLLVVKMLAPKPEPEVMLDEDGNPIVAAEEVEEQSKKPAIYFPLKPPIIVNFQARGRQRFLQAEVSIMSRDEDVILTVEMHNPMIRNSLVLLFSDQEYAELQTEAGRELLRQQTLVELRKIMQRELGKPGIEKVLFTNFVMQ